HPVEVGGDDHPPALGRHVALVEDHGQLDEQVVGVAGVRHDHLGAAVDDVAGVDVGGHQPGDVLVGGVPQQGAGTASLLGQHRATVAGLATLHVVDLGREVLRLVDRERRRRVVDVLDGDVRVGRVGSDRGVTEGGDVYGVAVLRDLAL